MLQLSLNVMVGRVRPLNDWICSVGPSLSSVGDLLPLARFPIFIIVVSRVLLFASSASLHAVLWLA
jgi:hypothetical protein